jgi:hypothetical protein
MLLGLGVLPACYFNCALEFFFPKVSFANAIQRTSNGVAAHLQGFSYLGPAFPSFMQKPDLHGLSETSMISGPLLSLQLAPDSRLCRRPSALELIERPEPEVPKINWFQNELREALSQKSSY